MVIVYLLLPKKYMPIELQPSEVNIELEILLMIFLGRLSSYSVFMVTDHVRIDLLCNGRS